jgi:hypothetical protein
LTPISIPEEAKLPSVHQLNPLAALLVITGLHHHDYVRLLFSLAMKRGCVMGSKQTDR